MGHLAFETATGLFRAWVSGDAATLPFTDPSLYTILQAEAPPPEGTFWNGTGWVPLPIPIPIPTLEERVAALEATTADLATKVGMATVAPVVP